MSLEDAEVLQQQRKSRANEYDKLAGRDSPKDWQPSQTKPKTQDKPWSKQGGKSPWKPQAKLTSSTEVKVSGTTLDPWANSRNKFKS